jgi:hydrogenase maturation protease
MLAPKPILILGIGNILLKDEGVGVHTANKMMKMDLPPDVEVMDGGTMGLNLLFYIEGRKKVIVIDTVLVGDPPGTIYRFTDESLVDNKPMLRTAHGVDFSDVIKTSKMLGTKPDEIIFIGIEPESLDEGLEMTPTIEKRVPVLIKMVMRELGIKTETNRDL